jgi:hypothetical protein
VTYHVGPIAELRQKLSTIERRGFGLAMTDPQFARLNQRPDTVVRMPSRGDAYRVPVGVVSKSYELLQHTEVLDFACDVLGKASLLAAAKKRGYLAASVGGEEAPVCGAVFGRKAPERKGRRVALSVW